MMKTRRLFSMGMILMTGMLFSCGGSNSVKAENGDSASNTPKSMTETFYGYMQKGEYEASVDYWMTNANVSKEISTERLDNIRLGFTALANKRQKDDQKSGGIKNIEVTNEEFSEDGNRATVTVKITLANGEEERQTAEFSKGEDGTWKFGTRMITD